MKKYLSVAFAALLMTGAATAQNVNLGVKAGLNGFTLEQDGSDFQTRMNFNGGLLAHIHLAPQFGLQPEVVFSGQGAKLKTGSVDSDIKLSYVNVPVLLQYMFDNGFRLQAGPQVGFLIAAKNEIGSVRTDVKDQYKTVDFAVTAGASYVHPASGFGVDARYNLGLSKINESSAVKDVTNRGFQVGVFYLFNHKN